MQSYFQSSTDLNKQLGFWALTCTGKMQNSEPSSGFYASLCLPNFELLQVADCPCLGTGQSPSASVMYHVTATSCNLVSELFCSGQAPRDVHPHIVLWAGSSGNCAAKLLRVDTLLQNKTSQKWCFLHYSIWPFLENFCETCLLDHYYQVILYMQASALSCLQAV